MTPPPPPSSTSPASRSRDAGSYHYSRDNIGFTLVAGTGYAGGSGRAVETDDAVHTGEGVVVIHGVDYNY